MSVPRPCRRAQRAFALLALLGLLPGALGAQAPPTVLGPDRVGFKAPRSLEGRTAASPGSGAPCCLGAGGEAALPPLPRGTGGNPEPKTPPATERVSPGGGTPAFGQHTFFKNTLVQPQGALRSTSSQITPSCVNVRDVVLQTGNWYAALSRDSGQTWTNLDPATFFPAPHAGFCCNQRVDYVPSHDVALWLLQYSYSPVSQKNAYQIAVANGRSELRSGDANDWTLYTFDPQDFGFPLGTSLDTPDVAFNRDWFYVASNVLSGSSLVGAVVWRMSLQDLRANGTVTFTYLTDSQMGGSSYRFADHAGDGTNMYWGSLMTTTTLRVWRQNTVGINRDFVDVVTAPWQTSGSITCQGPDGRGWVATTFGRIRGATGTASELVFTWPCHENGTSRPYPYTRVARLDVATRALLGEHDVYGLDRCWSYMAVESNTLGHVGGIVAIGGPNDYVRTSTFLVDAYTAWSGVAAYRIEQPTNNPPGGAFGVFFDVQRSAIDGRTFIGTGNLMVGGDAQANVQTRHVWFGRDDYTPFWATVNVRSNPVSGIPVDLDAADQGGNADGTTAFTRTYPPGQALRASAPFESTLGGTLYRFQRWTLDSVAQPSGQRDLAIGSLASGTTTLEAEYRAIRTLRFETSAHLAGGVRIAVPPDLDGNGNATTVFTRRYLEGAQLSLAALDAVVQGHPFKSWVVDGVRQPSGQRNVQFTVGGRDVRAVAEYWEHLPGTFTSFGNGCAGSGGVDLHDGGGVPELGQTLEWRLQGGANFAAAVVLIGASNTSWLGVSLPMLVPDAGDCRLRVSVDVNLATATNATGAALVTVPVPNDPALLGGVVYTQFACVDAPANVLGITLSNGLATRVGGLR